MVSSKTRCMRQRVVARNGPIHIYYIPDPPERDSFRYEVARASGRLGEYWKPRMQWYFWYAGPMAYQATTLGQPGEQLYVFRTFREACNKVKEIFRDGV